MRVRTRKFSIRFDYGKCPCGGNYENRSVEVRMTLEGRIVVLTDVPQGACPLCGSGVYKAEVIERIESLMKRQEVEDNPPHLLI